MNKIGLLSGIALMLFAKSGAAEVNYRVYSEEYHKCLAMNAENGNYDQCNQREYAAIKNELAGVLQNIKQASEFAGLNHSEKNIAQAVENMEKYNDLICEYKQAATQKQSSLSECKLEQINFLYVDLYRLYDELQKKKQRMVK